VARTSRPGPGFALSLALALALALGGCGSSGDPGTPAAPATSVPPTTPGIAVPPAGAPWDYQIGGAYPPREETAIVARDRTSDPAPGLYSICYVNAFQAQPDELAWWEAHHPDLLLRDPAGEAVVDAVWDEVLLDISTAARREALAEIVGDWFDGCAAAGFAAVEPDNLDSHTRSGGLLTSDDAAAFATLLAERAHRAGLAIAQKNDTDLAPRAAAIGFDFAIAEECGRWDECDVYTDAFGPLVLVVEYRDQDLAAACTRWPELSIVRRDRDVTARGSPAHRYAVC
jgi:hypothetical protein